MRRALLPTALMLGGMATYLDSRPGWDDTGMTAAFLFIVAAVFGFLEPTRPWVWALALSIWIPLLGFTVTHNYGTVLALAVALAGAYGGMAIRRLFLPTEM